MATTTATAELFEQAFDNVRKTAEASLKMQQDMYRQWAECWPGQSSPQDAWLEQMKKFHKQWSETVTGIIRNHRQVLDSQYDAAVNSLEEAFRAAESADPVEFRKRTEELCRNNLKCMRDLAESQLEEFQSAISKWVELAGKGGA